MFTEPKMSQVLRQAPSGGKLQPMSSGGGRKLCQSTEEELNPTGDQKPRTPLRGTAYMGAGRWQRQIRWEGLESPGGGLVVAASWPRGVWLRKGQDFREVQDRGKVEFPQDEPEDLRR